MKKTVLRLYICGETSRSMRATHNMRQICSAELKGEVDLEIIDVLKSPEEAEEHKIIATPTVVRVFPPPTRIIIGDFSNQEDVLFGLDLVSFEAHDVKG